MKRWFERRWDGADGQSMPPLATAVLAPLSVAFRGGVALRNALFDVGLRRAHRVTDAQVISVGNLTVGGSGKTPVVIFLAQWALACGRKVAVVSRGYGRTTTGDVTFDAGDLPPTSTCGDEPRLIARRCPGARVLVGQRRDSLVTQAAAEGANFIILDDGFQRRSIARDVDVVVVDGRAAAAERPHALPWGPFRELPSALSRASAVWLVGAPPAWVPASLPRVTAQHETTALVMADGRLASATTLRGRPVVTLCGIARPERFVRAVTELGATLLASFEVGDHAEFPQPLLTRVRAAADERGAEVVTTEKDAERLPAEFRATRLRLDVRLAAGGDWLASSLGLDAHLVPSQGV